MDGGSWWLAVAGLLVFVIAALLLRRLLLGPREGSSPATGTPPEQQNVDPRE